MDFKDIVKGLSDRAKKLTPEITTEEATKNALIMPFIQALGYDVFNPLEVKPEFVADLGIKKGEKVDYAILKEGKPIILIECKHHLENLDTHSSQLFRYFHTSNARFAILTNGLIYRFFTDLVEKNKMDEKPFLELNILDPKEPAIEEVKKFQKHSFNADTILTTASDLKYSNEVRSILAKEMTTPSPDFVKLFTKQVYTGPVTEKILLQFTDILKRASQQFLSDIISNRLKQALENEQKEAEQPRPEGVKSEIENPEDRIVTTEEEKEAYYIVKTILRDKAPGRVGYKDAVSLFTIVLDNSIRKPICRLYLNKSKKYIGFIDESKKEVRAEIKSIEDIYNYSDQLKKTVDLLEKSKEPVTQE